jgi:hypothetical protein
VRQEKRNVKSMLIIFFDIKRMAKDGSYTITVHHLILPFHHEFSKNKLRGLESASELY